MDALLSERSTDQAEAQTESSAPAPSGQSEAGIAVTAIVPSPYQPRRHFDP